MSQPRQRFYRVAADGTRTEFFPNRFGPRPRLCSECHRPATHVEYEQQPQVVIRAGKTLRTLTWVGTYWCGEHSGNVSA